MSGPVDTGGRSSLTFSSLIHKIKKNLYVGKVRELRSQCTQQLTKIAIYQFEIGDVNREFKICIKLNKLEKDVILELPNSCHQEIQKS